MRVCIHVVLRNDLGFRMGERFTKTGLVCVRSAFIHVHIPRNDIWELMLCIAIGILYNFAIWRRFVMSPLHVNRFCM